MGSLTNPSVLFLKICVFPPIKAYNWNHIIVSITLSTGMILRIRSVVGDIAFVILIFFTQVNQLLTNNPTGQRITIWRGMSWSMKMKTLWDGTLQWFQCKSSVVMIYRTISSILQNYMSVSVKRLYRTPYLWPLLTDTQVRFQVQF